MGRCTKRTKKKIKEAGRMLAGEGMKIIGSVVGALQDAKITNDEKRKLAVQVGTAATGAKEWAVAAAVELAVGALKDGQDALADLGAMDADDLAEVNE